MATYREAGVDIDAGDETVSRIKPIVRSTFTPQVLADIGAFGAFYELDARAYERPVLVSSVDGVGTKVMVAAMTGRHEGVGQDLVNHCVNDIAVCGATPLFFLDYYATGKLEPEAAEQIIGGFAKACRENGCALIGGETAEMPGLYRPGDYDLAGAIVGVVERARILDGAAVRAGDALLALPSTGLHTNGFSLARKALFPALGPDDAPSALGGASVADALLAVHRSYLQAIQTLHTQNLATGFAHITGGGLEGNTRRIVPAGLKARFDWASWRRPALFELIQEMGRVPEEDMRRTFNLGAGLVAAVRAEAAEQALAALEAAGETPWRIGEIVAA